MDQDSLEGSIRLLDLPPLPVQDGASESAYQQVLRGWMMMLVLGSHSEICSHTHAMSEGPGVWIFTQPLAPDVHTDSYEGVQ